jgi:hypothetical protein
MSSDELDYDEDDAPSVAAVLPPGVVVVLCKHDGHSEVYVVHEREVEFLCAYAGVQRSEDAAHALSCVLAVADIPVCGTCRREREQCRHTTERQPPLAAAEMLGAVVSVHDVAIRPDDDGRLRVLVAGTPHRVLGMVNLITSRQPLEQQQHSQRQQRPQHRHQRGKRARPYTRRGRHRVT